MHTDLSRNFECDCYYLHHTLVLVEKKGELEGAGAGPEGDGGRAAFGLHNDTSWTSKFKPHSPSLSVYY